MAIVSTKTLFILGLLFIIVSAYFYAQNDARLTQVSLKPTDIDYQAEQIKALQTTETGSIGYQLTAAQVTHYQNANTAVMSKPQIVIRPKNEREVTLVADQAQLDENKQIAKLIGNVTLTSVPLLTQNTSMSNLPVKMIGKNFVGDLVNNTVMTNEPLTFIHGNNRFDAKQFSGDLATGDYGFGQVSVMIQPAQ